MSFVVIKPFTYAGQPLVRGDVWEPTGHRTDAAIISARMVLAAEDAPAAPAVAGSVTRRRKAAPSAAREASV